MEHRANLRKHRLKKQYSLTIEAYDRMYREQQGTCSVCGDIKKHPATAGAKRNEVLHIDHCHKSGKVRALICAHCNKALGLFKENVKSLQNAIDYIEYFANLQLL
ncbi:MAG: hypothetical protein A2W17_09665 [Planctomycetes bacterium RBG_16_41_13]|nr:MAG: hypothetical protein A2W17_09665 [Planctomycetes bacterium RBG_16_41_13]